MSATRTPSLSRVTINKTITCYFSLGSHFGLYNGSNPCPCSFPRPARASLILLHHVLRRSILSLPSRCTLAQCRLNPPLLVHRWHRRLDTKHFLLPRGNLTLALRCRLLLDLLGQVPLTIFPLRCRVVGTRDPYPTYPNQTRSFDHAMVIGPGFNPCSVGYPLFFPLRCRVMWALVTPTPLLRIKIVRLTMRW